MADRAQETTAFLAFGKSLCWQFFARLLARLTTISNHNSLTFLLVLLPSQAYEAVLTEHGISPEEDTNYYRFLLKLSLDPDPDWWVKYEREKERLAPVGGLGGKSPLRAAVSLVNGSASVSRSAMRRGVSPYGMGGRPSAHEYPDDSREFARDLQHVRRRVMDEYTHERQSTGKRTSRKSRKHQYSTYDAHEEDPAESGYADFKLTAAAFRVWIRHVSSLRALRTAREAAVENWMISVSFWECNALKRALARWRARHNVMTLHALRFWHGENLRGRFKYWKEHTYRVRQGREEEAVNVKRALAAWSGKNLAYCFTKWQNVIADTNEQREDTLVVASTKRRARMFRAWSAEASRARTLSVVGGDVEAQATHRLKIMFYIKWRSAFHERQRRHDIMQRMSQRICNRVLSGALMGWRANVDKILDTQAMLENIVSRMRNRRLHAAFNTWSDRASTASTEREKLKSIAARIMHGSATRCLRAWRDLASEQTRLEELCLKVAHRISMMAAVAAFAKWRDFAEETIRHREVCSRVASRILNRVKHGAFMAWIQYAEAIRRDKESFERVKALPERRLARFGWTSWREAYQLRVKMRRTMQMLMNSSVVRTLRLWNEHVHGVKEEKNAAVKAMGFMLNRTVAGAFARWHEAATEQVELREKMHRVMARLAQRAMVGAFERWRECAMEQVELNEKMHRVMARLAQRSVVGAFERWREAVTELVELREKMHRVMARVAMRAVSGTFNRWREVATEQAELREKMHRVMARLAMRAVSGAFERWRAAANESNELQAKAEKVIARLAMRAASGAFARWREFVEETQHMRDLLSRAASALTKRCMMGAFALWKETLEEGNAQLEAAMRVIGKVKYGAAWAKWKDKVTDAREHKELLHKAANFIMNRAKSTTFYTWRENAETIAEMRFKIAGFVARMNNKGMSGAWEKWQNFLDDQQEMRDRAEKAMSWWTNKEKRSAFQRWSECVEASNAAKHALRFFTHRELSKAFQRWCEFVDNKHEYEEKMRVALSRFANKAMASAFERWLEFCEHADAARRAMSYFTNGTLLRALQTWSERVLEAAEEKNAVYKALRFMTNSTLRGAFQRWEEFAVESAELREKLTRAVSRFAKKALYSAFGHWKNLVADKQNAMEILSRALGKLHNRAKAQAFERWADAIADLKEKEDLVGKILYRILFRALRGAFERWQDFATEKAELRQKMERAVSRLKNRAISGAFCTWRGEVQEIVETRAMAAKAMGHFFQSAMRVAWQGWGAVVARRLENREFTTKALVLYAMSVQNKAFRRWRDAAGELADLREKLNIAVQRMGKRTMGGAFARWCEWLEEITEMREKLEFAAKRLGQRTLHAAFDKWAKVTEVELERRRILIAHVARRMNKNLGTVFTAWQEYVEFELRMRHVLDKAVRLMGNRALTAGWARWAEKVEEARRVRLAMRKFVYGAQLFAFSRWQEFYQEVLMLRRIGSAMAHANTQLMQRCVDKWCAHMANEKELEEKLKTLALKFFGNVKQKVWSEWVRYTVTMLRVKQLMGNGLKRTCRHALRAWSEEAMMAKVLRTKSSFLQQNSAAGVGRRVFRIWITAMFAQRHWRVRHSKRAVYTWTKMVLGRKEDKKREAKLAIVVKRLMFGNMSRVFAGWRLIPQRNKRFFRKQQALKRAIAAGDETIRRKRKVAVATAWRGWRYQMVDQEKMAQVKQMLSKRLGAARGTMFARWWSYVEFRRVKLEKFAVAKELHGRLVRRQAWMQWRAFVQDCETEMEAKLAKAMEFMFGASLAMNFSKWHALVEETKQKKMAMQRMVGLLTGFGLENLGAHVLREWREVCLAKRKAGAHLRKADTHRRAKVLDMAFLSWKVQSMPLSDADYLKAIGEHADDVWDRDFDDAGDPTELHAQVLVRRTRAMFDGRNPDQDDESREDEEAIRLASPEVGKGGTLVTAKTAANRAMRIAGTASAVKPFSPNRVPDSDSDTEETHAHRTPIGAGVGGSPSARPPASSSVGGKFCGECGAKFAAQKKFCSECGEQL